MWGIYFLLGPVLSRTGPRKGVVEEVGGNLDSKSQAPVWATGRFLGDLLSGRQEGSSHL